MIRLKSGPQEGDTTGQPRLRGCNATAVPSKDTTSIPHALFCMVPCCSASLAWEGRILGSGRQLPPLLAGGPLGGGAGLGWVKASPGRLPTVRAAFPAGPDWAALPGCPVTRPTGLLTAPRPRGGARGREMPPCLCVCALVCLSGGGGGLWHTHRCRIIFGKTHF